jgi:hypothetical protein
MFCMSGLISHGKEGVGFHFLGTDGVGSRFHVLRARTHVRRKQRRRVSFSSFVLPESFLEVPRTSGPDFMFCAPGHIFCCTECVGSRFHVLRSRTCFLRCRVRWVTFSCYVRLVSFFTVSRATGSVFIFCARRIVFGDNGGRRVPISCFARPDVFLAVPRASGPVFMVCSPGLIFGGTEGVRSSFHILRSRTRFRQCRVRRIPFSCFASPDSFSTVQRASGPVFKFCAPGLIFGDTEGVRPVFKFCAPRHVFDCAECVGSRFHVLCARTNFQRSLGRRVPFSCFWRYGARRVTFSCFARRTLFRRKRVCRVPFSGFAVSESFPAIPRASGVVFMFCTP